MRMIAVLCLVMSLGVVSEEVVEDKAELKKQYILMLLDRIEEKLDKLIGE